MTLRNVRLKSVTSNFTGGLLLAIALILSINPAAAGDGGGYKKEGRRGPPPEAIEACAGLQAEAACEFITPRGHEISGTCFVPPREGAELACKPAHGKKHRKEGHGAQSDKPADEPAAEQD
ncbi:MAG: hypothetical protein AAF431_05495 [Pseudomonadota bacterium]